VKFWILWGFDAAICLVVVAFFLIGIKDGSVSSFNLGLWLSVLLVLTLVLGGSLRLRSRGRQRASRIILWALAAPGILFLFFLLILVLSSPRWN
jgi:hypothetical protein